MVNKPWGQYERLKPNEIDSIKEKHPIAYIPWGALEWHSYHNPIGLDCLKAHGILCELAKAEGGIVIPSVYIGADTIKPFKGFPHTLDFPEELVGQLAMQFLNQLKDENFKVIVLFTGHYGGRHLEVLKNTAETFNKANEDVYAWFTSDYYLLEGIFEPNHAAWGETSFQMYFEEELVDLKKLPHDRQTTLEEDGVMGRDPREATKAGGKEQLEALLKNARGKISELRSKYIYR